MSALEQTITLTYQACLFRLKNISVEMLDMCPLSVAVLWFLRHKRQSEFPVLIKEKENFHFYEIEVWKQCLCAE